MTTKQRENRDGFMDFLEHPYYLKATNQAGQYKLLHADTSIKIASVEVLLNKITFIF